MPVFLFEGLILVLVGYVMYTQVFEPAWNNRPWFPWLSTSRTTVEAGLRQNNEDVEVTELQHTLEANRRRLTTRQDELKTATVVDEVAPAVVSTVEVAETASLGDDTDTARPRRKRAVRKGPARRRTGGGYSTE